MKKLMLLVLALGLLLAPGSYGIAAAQEKAAATSKTRDFGDWRLICETSKKSGQEQCAIFQRVLFGKDKPKGVALMMQVRIGKVKDKPATMVRLLTPLGTLLPPGMAIKIDDGKDIKVPFLLCLEGGCIVELAFEPDIVSKMKAGKAMLVAYKTPDGKSNTVKVSLKGFSEAVEALGKG
jgi:invasion protein IalB